MDSNNRFIHKTASTIKKSTLRYALESIGNQQTLISAMKKKSEREKQMAYVRGLRTMLDIILTEGYTKALTVNLSPGQGETDEKELDAACEFGRIDFLPTPDEEKLHTILFNRLTISEKDVMKLIDTGTWRDDDRVIHVSPEQANLFWRDITA